MPRFRYIAMDQNQGGAEVEGVVEAASQNAAIAAIKAQNMIPTRVSPVESGGKKPKAKSKPQTSQRKGFDFGALFAKRVKPKQLMVFTRQLATLLEAGLPLLRGLRILLKQEKTTSKCIG